VRTYKNTYIRWVCSGHNRTAETCGNAVTVDEDELIGVIENYFAEILSHKKNVINYVVNEFQKVYRAKDENVEYEKQLRTEIAKLERNRQKYMDMYTDDLITREELNKKIGGDKQTIERLQYELKMVEQHITKSDKLQMILTDTFKEIEDISNLREISNAQLRKVIDRIEVDHDGNVEIFLRLFSELGVDETVRISNDHTYRCDCKTSEN
jgi:hypothetical protein